MFFSDLNNDNRMLSEGAVNRIDDSDANNAQSFFENLWAKFDEDAQNLPRLRTRKIIGNEVILHFATDKDRTLPPLHIPLIADLPPISSLPVVRRAVSNDQTFWQKLNARLYSRRLLGAITFPFRLLQELPQKMSARLSSTAKEFLTAAAVLAALFLTMLFATAVIVSIVKIIVVPSAVVGIGAFVTNAAAMLVTPLIAAAGVYAASAVASFIAWPWLEHKLHAKYNDIEQAIEQNYLHAAHDQINNMSVFFKALMADSHCDTHLQFRHAYLEGLKCYKWRQYDWAERHLKSAFDISSSPEEEFLSLRYLINTYASCAKNSTYRDEYVQAFDTYCGMINTSNPEHIKVQSELKIKIDTCLASILNDNFTEAANIYDSITELDEYVKRAMPNLMVPLHQIRAILFFTASIEQKLDVESRNLSGRANLEIAKHLLEESYSAFNYEAFYHEGQDDSSASNLAHADPDLGLESSSKSRQVINRRRLDQ